MEEITTIIKLFSNRIKEIDVTHLEMPLPMSSILNDFPPIYSVAVFSPNDNTSFHSFRILCGTITFCITAVSQFSGIFITG